MTTKLRRIADELATVIEDAAFTGVEQVVGRLNLDPTPLSIDVYPADPLGNDEMRGFGDADGGYVFTIRARTHAGDSLAAQDLLLDLMDWDEGLTVALEDDQTLNGLASSVSVTGPTGLRPYRGKGESILIGCEWTATVIPEQS